MKKLIYLFLAATLIFTSCEKDDVEPPLPPVNGELTNDIIRDTTFKLGTYVIDGTIRVRNATVTIEPGVIFKFTDGSAFDVAYWGDEEATIIANGTEALPILFTSNSSSPENNSWDGFRFFHGTNNTVFNYCTFEYGGGSSYYSMVYMEECHASFTNCSFQKSAGIAIELRADAYFEAFDKNILAEIESYPMLVYADQIHTITGVNTYQTNLGILIPNDRDFRTQGDFTWTNQGVPYYQEGTIRFGSEGTGTILRINEGVVVKFMEEAQWDVAYWEDDYATIIAEGTAKDPIVFTSASTAPAAGDWDAILFYEGAINSSLNYCHFEYGGDIYYDGMLYINEAQVGINNCEFSYSASRAILAANGASFSSFGGNYFGENASFAISIFPNFASSIIGENTFSDMGILIANDGDLDIKGDYTWTNQGTPYTIEGSVRIGAEDPGVQLTIEAGTILKFYEDANFEIAYWGNHYGSLIADGTTTDPIIFTSAKPVPVAGDWDGIFFYEGSNNCIINNCHINYGGESYVSDGAIFLTDAGIPLTLSNTLISNSASNGISVDEDNNGSSVDYSNNVTFENLNGIEYYVR
ncbi:MAG: hypothetical protein GQ527_03725 [Bacteroidales bacterium]|nr:hypothetical protein [Bacteroidales bacterium]